MITYGRVEFLEESLHSFLLQDYAGEKELVIVNDYPLQKLVFNHPQVRIYNLDKTFETIGEKENYATELCKGDIICQWDDDDVAMPWHLRNVEKYFVEGSDLLHWERGVFFNNSEITSISGLGNSGIVFSKKIWRQLGGHPIENAGYDMTFVIKIKTHSQNIILANPPDNEVSWFYMWGGRGYHMSGMGTDTPDRENVIKRHSDHIESLRKQGKIPTGEVQLVPDWKLDYEKKLKDFNNAR
jgi:glycosyltransferase involved in cell wall biosynthesis